MKKLFLVLFMIFTTLTTCYAESDKESKGSMMVGNVDMGPIAEMMKEYMSAYEEAYKEMSKYHEPYYTYDNSILKGVVFVSGVDANGNVVVTFLFHNQSKSDLNVSEGGYRAVDNNKNVFHFEFKEVVQNDGIAKSNFINPKRQIIFTCLTPFKSLEEINGIKEIYVRFGYKRIFFVPEGKIKEYSKLENRILRHLKNLYFNLKW